MSACSSIPPRVPEQPVKAIADFSATPLSASTQKVLSPDTRSAFQLPPYGPTPFATRIAMAKLATHSLDVQYYLLSADDTSRALMREQAATGPATCRRVADRSAVLAAMAARTRELLERGRLIVEGRDNEVQLLLGTVKNDRALLAPP